MKIERFGTGKVLFNIIVGVHGDEKSPVKGLSLLKKYLKNKKINKGFQVIMANEEALRLNKRFIDKDLNRSFPGSNNGCLEEKLAIKLRAETIKTEYNFDFHSTPTPIKAPYGVFSVYSNKLGKIMAISGVKNWVFDASESLIKFAPEAFAIEVGCEVDSKSAQNAFLIMKNILVYFKVLHEKNKGISSNPNLFLIYHFIAVNNLLSLNKEVQDFKYIKKGQIIGLLKNKKPLVASEGFYPVLINHDLAIKKAKKIIIKE